LSSDISAIANIRPAFFRFNSRLHKLITLKFLEDLDGILIPRWRSKHVCIYATKPNIRQARFVPMGGPLIDLTAIGSVEVQQ
jgi:hypothetical protein